jgi:membrane-associated phospholipid phosphatase
MMPRLYPLRKHRGGAAGWYNGTVIDAATSQDAPRDRRPAIRFVLPLIAFLALIPATLHGYVHNDLVKDIASQLGGQINTDMIVLTFVVFCVTAYKRRKTTPGIVWWALDIALATVILVDSGKLTGLRRPNGGPHGFPSGHTGLLFSLAWIVEEMYPALGPIWYAFAVIIGWSRIEVSAHFPYQVLCGAPMGFAVAWAVTTLPDGLFVPRIFRWFRRRRTGRNG